MVTPSNTLAVTMTWNSILVGGATNVRLTNGPALVDVTTIGTAFVARYPVVRDWSITFDMIYDIADPGQYQIVTDAYSSQVARTLVLNLPGSHTLTGSAFIESFDYTFDPKEVIRVSVSIKGTGLMVYA